MAAVFATVGQTISVIVSNVAKKTFQNGTKIGTDGLRIVKCYVSFFGNI